MIPDRMADRDSILGFHSMALALSPANNGYISNIPPYWRQGRTAYGGLTAGLSLAAIEKDFPDLPSLRSIQITFVGPVAENATFKTRKLRQGRNVTTIEVQTLSGDDVSAIAICMFGKARKSDLSETITAPAAPAPDDCEPFIPPEIAPTVPVFFQRFETKLIEGHRPLSGADKAYIRCWSRHVDENSRSGMAAFITLGDVLPPAALPTFKRMGPISSMNWQMNILVDDIDSDGGWYQVETQQSAAKDGYSSQPMRFWNRKGDLIAEGMQSVAIFV